MEIQGLTIAYKQKVAIDNVTLQIASGKLTGIVGPNGAGKSTLLKGMMGLIPREQGQVTLADKPLTYWRKKIAYVPQRSEVDLTFPITVFDMVLLGTYPALGLIKRPGKKRKATRARCVRASGNDRLYEKTNRRAIWWSIATCFYRTRTCPTCGNFLFR